MSKPTFAGELAASPALFPFAIQGDGEEVDFLRLSPADYANASFLDKRMLTADLPRRTVAWAEVRDAAASLPLRCHFIFHISHVGSTLLARLLGDAPGLFALREPAIFRTLADAQFRLGQSGSAWSQEDFDERLETYLKLWSRTFAPGETSVIKATSFVAEMSSLLLERVSNARAILMLVSPVTFMAALLDGAMSDIFGQAERRLPRLHRRLGAEHWRQEDLSPGECVAMSWLCEVLSLHAAAERFPERIFWLDFDRFLTNVPAGLAASLRHLTGEADAATVREILARPTMAHYAKQPEHAFNAETRQVLLQQSMARHMEEIKRGMAWLQRAAQLSGAGPKIAAVQVAVQRPYP